MSSTGPTQGFRLPEGVRLQVGHQSLNADPAVVVDLSAMSRMHGIEVSGVIGFPAIRRSVVSIDYRNMLVTVEKKAPLPHGHGADSDPEPRL